MQKQNNDKFPKELAKYSGLGLSMAAIIGLLAYVGTWVDEYLSMSRPIFTIIFSLLGVFAAMYFTLKEFIHKNK